MITVERIPVGALAVNCYLVGREGAKECVVVDPGDEAERIAARIGDRTPVAVLLTHAHYDHIGAVDALCARYGIPLYAHEADAAKLGDPVANVSALFGEPLVQQTLPRLLHGGETLTLAGIPLWVMHTPGHSMGSVCYVLPEEQGVLTGDTLFAHGYGRTDFPDGDFALLHRSLRELYRLSPRRIAYPGHEATGMVGHDTEWK